MSKTSNTVGLEPRKSLQVGMTKEELAFLDAASKLFFSTTCSEMGRGLHMDAAYVLENYNFSKSRCGPRIDLQEQIRLTLPPRGLGPTAAR